MSEHRRVGDIISERGAIMQYRWRHGENDLQEYFDVKIGKDYLCVFRNKFEETPNTWMGHIEEGGLPTIVWDKTANDKQRKKQGLDSGADLNMLWRQTVLTNTDPIYMMIKVEECYKKSIREVRR